jgi:hypothetical protein
LMPVLRMQEVEKLRARVAELEAALQRAQQSPTPSPAPAREAACAHTSGAMADAAAQTEELLLDDRLKAVFYRWGGRWRRVFWRSRGGQPRTAHRDSTFIVLR